MALNSTDYICMKRLCLFPSHHPPTLPPPSPTSDFPIISHFEHYFGKMKECDLRSLSPVVTRVVLWEQNTSIGEGQGCICWWAHNCSKTSRAVSRLNNVTSVFNLPICWFAVVQMLSPLMREMGSEWMGLLSPTSWGLLDFWGVSTLLPMLTLVLTCKWGVN